MSALINKTNHENTKINTRKPQMVVSLVSLEDLILYLSLHHIGALTIEVTSPFLIFEIITLFHLKKYSYYYYSRKLTILELIIVFTLMIHLYLIEKKKKRRHQMLSCNYVILITNKGDTNSFCVTRS